MPPRGFHVSPLAEPGTPSSERSHRGTPEPEPQRPCTPGPFILEPLRLEVAPFHGHVVPLSSMGTPRASARRTTSPSGTPTQPLPPCPQPLAPSLLTVPEQDVIDTAAGHCEGKSPRSPSGSRGLGERLERPPGHRRKAASTPDDPRAVMERLEASARSVEKKVDQIWGVLAPEMLERLIVGALQRVLKGHQRSAQAPDPIDASHGALGLQAVSMHLFPSGERRGCDWTCCGRPTGESEDGLELVDLPVPIAPPVNESRRVSVREVLPAFNPWRTTQTTHPVTATRGGVHPIFSQLHSANAAGGQDYDVRMRSRTPRTPRTPQGDEKLIDSNPSVASEERLVLDQWGPACSPAMSEISQQWHRQQSPQLAVRSDFRDSPPMMTRVHPQDPPSRRRSVLGDRQPSSSRVNEAFQACQSLVRTLSGKSAKSRTPAAVPPERFKWSSKAKRSSLSMTRTRSQVRRNASRMASKRGRLVLFLCTTLVIINAAWVGFRSHYVIRMELMRHGVVSHWDWSGSPRSAAYAPPDNSSTAEFDELRRTQGWGHPVLDSMFTLLFLAEVVVRMFLARGDFIWGEQRRWNFFDVVLVFVTIVHWIINVLLIDALNVNVWRLPRVTFLRILRLPRVAIDLKHLDSIHSLQLMTASIIQSLSFSWVAFSVIMGLIYLFSVCFVQGFIDALENAEVGSVTETELADVATKFGSVQITTFSLFQAISGGVDWKELLEPLSLAPWRYTLLLFVYIFVLIFGVLNIVTSMFVECVYHVTKEDYKERIRTELHAQHRWEEELRRIFVEADEDESGSLSWKEFSSVVGVDDFKAHFATLKLNIEEAKEIFDYLDVQGDGEVHMQDFVRGCVCLRGEARSVDLAVLKSQWDRTSRHLMEEVKRLSRHVEGSRSGTEATLFSRPKAPTEFSRGASSFAS